MHHHQLSTAGIMSMSVERKTQHHPRIVIEQDALYAVLTCYPSMEGSIDKEDKNGDVIEFELAEGKKKDCVIHYSP
jgi:hypothetical protein